MKNITIIKNPDNNNNLNELLKKNWKVKFKKILKNKGAILFRGFNIENIQSFNNVVKTVHKKILNYEEASTPRSKVKGKVYTSTEISPKVEIPIHNEMSYASKYPKNLWFYSSVVAKKGGQTTIASSKKIYNEIDKKIRDEFENKKIMYVRRYGYGVDLSLKKTFNTKNITKISNYCKKNNLKFKWEGKDKLITWKINNFSIYNKNIKSKIWFNQAHLFHNSSYNKKTKFLFKKLFGENIYPRDAKFSNGKEIPVSYLKKIRKILSKNSKNINWKPNDILVINNLLVSHGRRKYSGDRKVYVLMTNDN